MANCTKVDENSSLISYDSDGMPVFKRWSDCFNAPAFFPRECPLYEQIPNLEELMYSIQIVPCDSDPTLPDTDGDTVCDCKDPLRIRYGISELFREEYRNKLFEEIDLQVKKDFLFLEQYKSFYSTQDCLDIIYSYDELITNLSNEYLLPKAAIQTVLFRELRCYDALDELGNLLVEEWYLYLHSVDEYNNLSALEKVLCKEPSPPYICREDSSVGYGQIIARTGISAHDWGVRHSFINGEQYNIEDWKDWEKMWRRLKTDNDYNVSMIPIVLMWGAEEQGLHNEYWAYDEQEIKTMLRRYNGTGDRTIEYRDETYNCYVIFDKYNYCN